MFDKQKLKNTKKHQNKKGAKKFGVPLKVPDVLDIVEPTEVKKVYVNTELENKSVELFSKEAFEKITKVKKKKSFVLFNFNLLF